VSDVPTVFVVDDDAAVRDALRWLVEPLGLPVEVFPGASAFLAAYDPSRPGCLVLDVRMPGMSGPELQTELAKRGSRLPIIMVTAHGTVPLAVRAVQAGALDVIEKPYDPRQLLERIHQAIAADRRALQESAEREEVEKSLAQLTKREREILQALLAGKGNKGIAAEFSISPRTVEVHRAHILLKLRAKSLLSVAQLLEHHSVSPIAGRRA
jgi:RNA polymerase sigma factor (sigma-70 family)